MQPISCSRLSGGVTPRQGPTSVVPNLGAWVVLSDSLQMRGNVWRTERDAGLARIAEQRVHRVPPNPRHRIIEGLEDVWNCTRVWVLVEDLKTTTANHRTRVR